jgi:hypothetical protein
MFKLTEEQQNIILNLKNGYNVLVDSVAGSGKTTTNLGIAQEFSDKNILLLTYNAKLKFETREKCVKMGIKNMEVHSYHSFCVKNLDKTCFTDSGMIKMLKDENKMDKIYQKKFHYDIILIDEAQDMTPLYFEIISILFSLNQSDFLIGIIGDQNQSIFDFNKADARFIKFGKEIFDFNKKIWKENKLSISFRITNEMANFINYACLGQNRIRANKKGEKPLYLVTDSFGETMDNDIFILIKDLLKKYQSNDFFILAPSLKNAKSPCRVLENKLKKELKIPIYVPVSDEEKIDEEVVKNKMVFSTFHQVKGLERKVVIIYNFDKSYFDYFKKDKNPKEFPNELYVACTRALDKLILIHHYQNEYLPFLNQHFVKSMCDFRQKSKLKVFHSNKTKNQDTNVTDLIKHLPQEVINTAMEFLNIQVIQKKNSLINIPIKTTQETGDESVSEITGIAIPTYFEYKLKNKSTILEELLNDNEKTEEIEFIDDEETDNKDNKKLNQLDLENPEDLLYLSNLWNTKKSGYFFKQYQIQNYDWLSKEHLDKSYSRLNKLNLDESSQFEVKLNLENTPELYNRNLIGYLDCISINKIYEFKCVKELSSEYFLQVALYQYLLQTVMKKKDININMEFYLYNVLSDEMYQITSSYENICQLTKFLIESKYFNKKSLTDEAFINLIDSIKNKIKENKNDKEIVPLLLMEEKTKNSKYFMILDTETTGLPRRKVFTPENINYFNSSRMIELGYIIYDENNKEIKRYNSLIKPDNFEINNTHIHGITTKDCKTKGLEMKVVLNNFYLDLLTVDKLICHNIDFDYNILLNEAYRSNHTELFKTLENINKICTQKLTKDLYGKKTKLSNWYKLLFNEDPQQNHRALDDVIILEKCYFSVKNQ